ncbi:hypothetical protein [Curtobacterium sp. MCSS17_015]|uniref:hypothetical protein n=1 Tax=Curtobacterium sp. MCSS17_015 TaxID=2175666 RepID=UPI000DAA6029|nr:hypothetical protein [Curtobacterium sp. MCSS17_015]WIB25423.1 hypothetical protein DEJ18_10175 [Curtobacterium sp. MCSS17_015]
MTTNLTHPKGQTVTVPDEAAAYYLEKGWSVAGAETPHERDVVEIPEGVPEESWKGDQLDAYAEREGIDLGSASKKADKVAVIVTALQEKEAADGADTGNGTEVPDPEAGS